MYKAWLDNHILYTVESTKIFKNIIEILGKEVEWTHIKSSVKTGEGWEKKGNKTKNNIPGIEQLQT